MLRVALGGFLIAIRFPQVLSAGYPVIILGLRGGIELHLFPLLLVLKMLATSIALGSGAMGGLFAPTLVIGAMYGGVFGYGFHRILPSVVRFSGCRLSSRPAGACRGRGKRRLQPPRVRTCK
jgi:CIC family chloride channel protein